MAYKRRGRGPIFIPIARARKLRLRLQPTAPGLWFVPGAASELRPIVYDPALFRTQVQNGVVIDVRPRRPALMGLGEAHTGTMMLGLGLVGLMGLGLFYGMARATVGRPQHRWGGL